jgi:hypothetical protein
MYHSPGYHRFKLAENCMEKEPHKNCIQLTGK